MKKLLLSLIALIAFSFNASADETSGIVVGNEDNSSTWWTAFSKSVSLTGDGSLTFIFTNYSSKKDTWNNWLAVCTNDVDRGGTGYHEYFVMRADNYGWCADDGWNTANTTDVKCPGTLESHYNWDTFKDDMDGATVNLTLIRCGNYLKLRALTTTAAGNNYYETYEQEVENLPETIRLFLTTELGHLEITEIDDSGAKAVYRGATGTYADEQYSGYGFPIPATEGVYVNIFDDGAYIYDYCGVPGYDLLLGKTDGSVTKVAQSVYGVESERPYYGYLYAKTGLSSPDIEEMAFYPGWDMTINTEDATSGYILLGAYMYVGETSNWQYYYLGWGDATPTGISAISADKSSVEGPAYNLAGQRVSKAAKGLVIMNGKKYFNK